MHCEIKRNFDYCCLRKVSLSKRQCAVEKTRPHPPSGIMHPNGLVFEVHTVLKAKMKPTSTFAEQTAGIMVFAVWQQSFAFLGSTTTHSFLASNTQS